ncbi:MAG: hypothetical protein D3914_13790 [Candidatus Electrothrix sp. LOE2]|nr:hypothetical protein [Candidatus Electrothrix sp. LOE2]
MGPTDLSDALAGLTPPNDPKLLVGIETSDDAAVYRLNDEVAMINTVDFITPPVDDPYWFGQIAAANSISDVYSMGGRPVTAPNEVSGKDSSMNLVSLAAPPIWPSIRASILNAPRTTTGTLPTGKTLTKDRFCKSVTVLLRLPSALASMVRVFASRILASATRLAVFRDMPETWRSMFSAGSKSSSALLVTVKSPVKVTVFSSSSTSKRPCCT